MCKTEGLIHTKRNKSLYCKSIRYRMLLSFISVHSTLWSTSNQVSCLRLKKTPLLVKTIVRVAELFCSFWIGKPRSLLQHIFPPYLLGASKVGVPRRTAERARIQGFRFPSMGWRLSFRNTRAYLASVTLHQSDFVFREKGICKKRKKKEEKRKRKKKKAQGMEVTLPTEKEHFNSLFWWY